METVTPSPHAVRSATLAPESGPYVLALQFGDGLERDVDFGPWLRANAGHPLFRRLLEPSAFAAFDVADGELSWEDAAVDFHPADLRAGQLAPTVAGT